MYRPYRAECSSVVVTQGGASLCPGLACFGPYGANKQMVGNAHLLHRQAELAGGTLRGE